MGALICSIYRKVAHEEQRFEWSAIVGLYTIDIVIMEQRTSFVIPIFSS